MGTVQNVHSQYRVYTDPKSGVEIHIWKDKKSEGYFETAWKYGTAVGQTDDLYTSLKAAWSSMQQTVRETHQKIQGMTPDQLKDYANQPYLHDIGKAIARAMAKKAIPVNKQSMAKAIVIGNQSVEKFVDSSECIRELSSFINNEPSRKYLRLTFSLWKKEGKSKLFPAKPGFKKLWAKLGETLEGAVNVGNEDGWEYDEDVQALDHLYEVIVKAR